jgi:hypothetical protein
MYVTKSDNAAFPKKYTLCDASTGRAFETGKLVPDSEHKFWRHRGHTLVGLSTNAVIFFVDDQSPKSEDVVIASIQNLGAQSDRDRASRAYDFWRQNPDQYILLSSQGDIHSPLEIDATTFIPAKKVPSFVPPDALREDTSSASSQGGFSASTNAGTSNSPASRAGAHGRAGGSLFTQAVVASIAAASADDEIPQNTSEGNEAVKPRPSRIRRALMRSQFQRLVR